MQFENQDTAKILQYDIASFSVHGPEVIFSTAPLGPRTVIHSPFQQTIRRVKWFSKSTLRICSDCDNRNFRFYIQPTHDQMIDYLTHTAVEWVVPTVCLKNTPSSFTFTAANAVTYSDGDTLSIGGVTTATFGTADTWTRGTSVDADGEDLNENLYHYVPRDYQGVDTLFGATYVLGTTPTLFDGVGIAGQHPQTTLLELFNPENLAVDLPRQRVSWTQNLLTNYLTAHFKINGICQQSITGHDADNREQFGMPNDQGRVVHSQWRGNIASLVTPLVAAQDDSPQVCIESEKLCKNLDWSWEKGLYNLGDKVQIRGLELMNFLGNIISFELEAGDEEHDLTDYLVCEREMMYPLSTAGNDQATENDRIIHLYLAGSNTSIYSAALTPLDPVIAPLGRSSSIYRRVQRASESSLDPKEQVLIVKDFIEPIKMSDIPDPNLWAEFYTTTAGERNLQRRNCRNKIFHGSRMETRYCYDVAPGEKASFEVTEFAGPASTFYYGFINETSRLGGMWSNYTNDPLLQADAEDSVKDLSVIYNNCDYAFKKVDPRLQSYLQSLWSGGFQPDDIGYHMLSKAININTVHPAGCFNPGSNDPQNPIQSMRIEITSRPTVTKEQQLRNQLEQRDRVPVSDATNFEGLLTHHYTGYLTAVLHYVLHLNAYNLVEIGGVHQQVYQQDVNYLV